MGEWIIIGLTIIAIIGIFILGEMDEAPDWENTDYQARGFSFYLWKIWFVVNWFVFFHGKWIWNEHNNAEWREMYRQRKETKR